MSNSPPEPRQQSSTARLIRMGFTDATRAIALLGEEGLRAAVGTDPLAFAEVIAGADDPDLALLQLVRLLDAVGTDSARYHSLSRGLSGISAFRHRLVSVMGASAALGDEIIRRPALLDVLAAPDLDAFAASQAVRDELLAAVGAHGDSQRSGPGPHGDAMASGTDPVGALRRAYRTRLLRIAAEDVTCADPSRLLPDIAAALADLAAAALEAALAIARSRVDGHEAARLAVIGMGKCGARELNYVSDVDVIYVVQPRAGFTEAAAIEVGTRLAMQVAGVCSGPSDEPALWAVDAALRPEGSQGPLVRTVDSHLAYYRRWAKTWEFQALIKARWVAGDQDVAGAYCDSVAPLVWAAAGREGFVADTQAMRRRVEENIPAAAADRELKLGKGGLRDVEFTIQLLQLVHGRFDPALRSAETLSAVDALARGGYVGREHAVRLSECYRFLRLLEHRIQLVQLRRTHLMPTAQGDLRRLARAVGMRTEGIEGLLERWRATIRDVRALHEALFYRPLLPATAQLSPAEVSLAPEVAQARFTAIGYRDPAGAMRHVLALTQGMSRRATIQRHLLPVLLGWFAEGADPDAGLLAFRTVSEELGRTHWYLKLLRDSGSAAHRLAHVLSNSTYLAQALARSPESIAWLDDDADLAPRGERRLRAASAALTSRANDVVTTATSLRALRRRELARTASAQVLGRIGASDAQRAISEAADMTLCGLLDLAEQEAATHAGFRAGQVCPARVILVAVGRLGGRELSYGSDADVLFAYQPAPGVPDAPAQAYAQGIAARVRQLAAQIGPEPALVVDADLRPEGRQGVLVRSIDSYRDYYARWSRIWEAQALLRARALAGPPEALDEFMSMVDRVRYPADGLTESQRREIRHVKARVEAERLPRGGDRHRHLKLGRGGIADVEWTVQLVQLAHGGQIAALRTTSTTQALAACVDADLIAAPDAEALAAAWDLASRIRSALVLWTGQTSGPTIDVLPHDHRDLVGVARVLDGSGRTSGQQLEDAYLGAARRARAVMERVFYG